MAQILKRFSIGRSGGEEKDIEDRHVVFDIRKAGGAFDIQRGGEEEKKGHRRTVSNTLIFGEAETGEDRTSKSGIQFLIFGEAEERKENIARRSQNL